MSDFIDIDNRLVSIKALFRIELDREDALIGKGKIAKVFFEDQKL